MKRIEKPSSFITVDMLKQLDPKGAEFITQEHINAAIASVRNICGWHVFPSLSDSITLTEQSGDTIILPTKSDTVVNSIEVYASLSQPEGGQIWTTRAGGEFVAFPGGIVKLVGIQLKPGYSVNVDFEHGFGALGDSVDSYPQDLISVVLAMASRAAQPSGAITVGGISMGATTGITPQSHEYRILDTYKLRALP